jgi:hypothetical protein
VLAAQALVFAAVLGGGILIGIAVDDDPAVPTATQERLDRAEGEAAENAELLRLARNELGTGRAQARRRIDSLARQNRSLRRALARTRRALRRARD